MVADEREKLKALLNYWLEHNKEHSEEFREWAGKARNFGEAMIHDDIVEAAQQMDKANEFLLRALQRLKQ
jgi:hypothetical protein